MKDKVISWQKKKKGPKFEKIFFSGFVMCFLMNLKLFWVTKLIYGHLKDVH